ncbi:MAG: dihydroorotase [Clostridia bacterium]|nr:dihydroorotase [Clostridia bacterium]
MSAIQHNTHIREHPERHVHVQKPLLLIGGHVRSANGFARQDILIRGGIVETVGTRLDESCADKVDCEGLVLSPGFIDLHTHLREPGFSEKETIRTGTMAAAAGGFSTVCAMPNLSPVPGSMASLREQLTLIERDAVIEVLPYGAITQSQEGRALTDIEGMAEDCVGYSDDGRGVKSRSLMLEAMQRVKDVDRLIAAHCEDSRYATADARSEWKQLERDLSLAAETGVRYHVCHVSAKESVSLIRQAKANGLPVSCECTPHQIMLSAEDITADDGRFKMNPPLRARADHEAIVRGLLDGTIDCIATDHAPHTEIEKEGGFAGSLNGVVGLETAFAVCHTALVQTGLCTLEFLLDKLTEAPARILKKTQTHGRIAPGRAANIALLDVQGAWTVCPKQFQSKGKSSPFQGMKLIGLPKRLIYNGLFLRPGGKVSEM